MAWKSCDDGPTVDAPTTSCLQPRSAATFANAENIPQHSSKMSLPVCPRTITAMQLSKMIQIPHPNRFFCGPPSEPGESGLWEERALEVSEISRREGGPETGRERAREPKARQGQPRQDVPRCRQSLVAPSGDVFGDAQKFICVFQIGLEDDEEFCLVKRILGKAGNNMRRIAEECSAKVRLRGLGSGFVEGADGKEANMPLQLNVCCTDFDSYRGAAERVATLLREIYKHFRRYIRSKGMDPPDLKISLEEVRRDDLNLDLLSRKDQRFPSKRERDRRALLRERRQNKEKERERAHENSPDTENAHVLDFDDDEDGSTSGAQPLIFPGGLPAPTTPAGRRAAAHAGGAVAVAIASAVSRQVERQERERTREDREEQLEKDRERKRERGVSQQAEAALVPEESAVAPCLWAVSPADHSGRYHR